MTSVTTKPHRVSSRGTPIDDTRWRRVWHVVRRAVRVEDLALFAWVAVIQPLTLGNHARGIRELGSQGTAWGIAYVLAACAAVVCLASHSPDEPTLSWTTASLPHSFAPLPFVVGIAILFGFGMQDIGAMRADAAFLIALVIAFGAFFLYADLPTLPAALRRAGVMPMALVASMVFSGMMYELFSQIDAAVLIQASVGLAVFVLLYSAGFYLFFIFAPAQIATAGGSWTDWGVRYGSFVVASIIGISVLGSTA